LAKSDEESTYRDTWSNAEGHFGLSKLSYRKGFVYEKELKSERRTMDEKEKGWNR